MHYVEKTQIAVSPSVSQYNFLYCFLLSSVRGGTADWSGLSGCCRVSHVRFLQVSLSSRTTQECSLVLSHSAVRNSSDLSPAYRWDNSKTVRAGSASVYVCA